MYIPLKGLSVGEDRSVMVSLENGIGTGEIVKGGRQARIRVVKSELAPLLTPLPAFYSSSTITASPSTFTG